VQYVIAQVLGGIAGAAILYVIATGRAETGIGSFATNGFGEHSPGGYGLLAAAVIEVVMTFGFVTVILGVTDKRAAAFAPAVPLAIGLTLTLIHLISIPVTNTSVNPARSTAPALFVGGPALAQLWLFWVAPLVGGAIAGLAYGLLGRKD
jgi:aquaporin Z